MFFLTISNVDVDFQAQDLKWRSYTVEDIFSTTRRVRLIKKKEFATVTLDSKHEAFIIHVAVIHINSNIYVKVYSSKKA